MAWPLRKKQLFLKLLFFFPKIFVRFFLSKSVFSYFKTKKKGKKVPMATKLEGRGGGGTFFVVASLN